MTSRKRAVGRLRRAPAVSSAVRIVEPIEAHVPDPHEQLKTRHRETVTAAVRSWSASWTAPRADNGSAA